MTPAATAALEVEQPRASSLWPGVALCLGLAALILFLDQKFGLGPAGPVLAALAVGVVWRTALGLAPALAPGVRFTARVVLRLAVVLLGLRVAVQDLAAIGVSGIAVCALCLVGCWFATLRLGRALKVEPVLTRVIAAGVSVCGASAAGAVGAALRARDEDVAYALAVITVAGGVAMAALPWLGLSLGLSPTAYGLWVGGSVHEVAQAAGAATALGEEAGVAGVIAKLSRVLMLAPLVLLVARAAPRPEEDGARPPAAPFPWFILGFVALALIAWIWPLPQEMARPHALLTSGLLCASVVAMGLQAPFSKLAERGWRPLLLCAAASLFISLLALGLALIAVRLPF